MRRSISTPDRGRLGLDVDDAPPRAVVRVESASTQRALTEPRHPRRRQSDRFSGPSGLSGGRSRVHGWARLEERRRGSCRPSPPLRAIPQTGPALLRTGIAGPVDRPGPQHVGPRQGRPSSSWTARDASISRTRSIPVSTPISSSIETRSSVEMLPVEPGGTGQPPSSPNGGLERRDALLQGGEHVGEALAAGVVEVGGELDLAEPVPRGGEELLHLPRVRHPRGVAERDLRAAGAGEALGDPEHALDRGHRPRRGQPKLVEITPSQRSPSSRARSITASRPASDSSIERLTFLRLWVSDAERKRLTSSKRSRWASARSSPRSFGIRTEYATPSTRATRDSTSSASASCGITSARTNEVTSSRRRPLRASMSMRRSFSSVGITSGSFWNPSRGPTSRTSTDGGRSVMPERLGAAGRARACCAHGRVVDDVSVRDAAASVGCGCPSPPASVVAQAVGLETASRPRSRKALRRPGREPGRPREREERLELGIGEDEGARSSSHAGGRRRLSGGGSARRGAIRGRSAPAGRPRYGGDSAWPSRTARSTSVRPARDRASAPP